METEPAAASAAVRGALARHPTAVECVFAVGALTDSECDVVVFEEQRAFRVASTESTVLQPRHLVAAERQLLESDDRCRVEDGAGAFAVRDGQGEIVGSLTIHRFDGLGGTEPYVRFARLIATLITDAVDGGRSAEIRDAVLDGLRDVVVVLDSELKVKWVNDAVGSLFGRTAADIVGRSAIELLHPEDVSVAMDAILRLQQGLELYRPIVRLEHGNGSYQPVEVTGFDQSSHPVLQGTVMSLRLAAMSEELEAAVERTNLMSRAIVAGLYDGIVATDQFGAITLVNHVARTMFGLDGDAPPAGLALADFAILDRQGRALDWDLATGWGEEDDHVTRDICVVSARGQLRYVTAQRRSVRGSEGEVLGSVIAFHDVTEAHRAAEELRTQALHDQLTGLANRRLLEHRLTELGRVEGEVQVAACFVDLDGFKLVNDTHGHRVGDELIRIAAKRLDATLREDDLLVRQGGDEFVALLVGVSSVAQAVETAERLREKLSRPFVLDQRRFDLTASVGVALASTDDLGDENLLRHADIALYAAKEGGRNRVELFDDELAVAVEVEEHQRRMLRDALENGRLVMHFQPLVDASSGETYGYEALARVRNDRDELVGPASFMAAISNSGLMWDLDRAAFALSCQAAAVLAKVSPFSPPTIACNFSAISLSQPDIVDVVLGIAEENGVVPSQICIEITESSAFDAGPQTLAALRDLHGRGFLLALDDFGTGYSSLAHLRDLPLTSVKVDRSFIARLGQETSEQSIVAAVVSLAHDLGLGAVAEGVETAEQDDHAKRLGFSTIQGWHYAPAMALTEILSDWIGPDVSKPA